MEREDCRMKKKLLILVLVALVCVTAFASISKVTASPSYQIDKNIEAIMDGVDKAVKEDPVRDLSSNPYDYIVNNENYLNIVNLGSASLVPIREKITNSNENGLKEYILAIAGEEIAKVNLRGNSFLWSNGKEWAKEWDRHLGTMQDNIERITLSQNPKEDKVNALIKLGTPAIPFIMDKIENGDEELVPALDELLKGNSKVLFDKTTIKDNKEWVKNNKIFFEDLREMVVNTKQ
jgi:hypothetical protein